MNTLSVETGHSLGRIKPMHAVNNLPCVPFDTGKPDLLTRLEEAGVPFSRLHDTGGLYGGARYVDIANLFPDFAADETDPASYDFAFTDVLLRQLESHHIRPFFRLGATIENFHRIKAYRIFPPTDFDKWARICEHIIRHYTEGWAEGFRMDIPYWEIWNEPDNDPEIADNPMWKGTPEQFFELYEVCSRHLKTCFPQLRIGGYGCCGFYALSQTDVSAEAHSTSRVEYFLEFLHRFLTYARAHGSVLDFFSWHSYADSADNARYAAYARKTLDDYGYTGCEIFLDEWNPGSANRGTQRDAAEILTAMCRMQNTPTDMCMYYDAQIVSDYCGLFDPVKHEVFPAYQAFVIFGRLYALGTQLPCSADGGELCALAATDGQCLGVAVANPSDRPQALRLTVDEEEQLPEGADGALAPYEIRYYTFDYAALRRRQTKA